MPRRKDQGCSRFPNQGVLFKDITTLLKDADALSSHRLSRREYDKGLRS